MKKMILIALLFFSSALHADQWSGSAVAKACYAHIKALNEGFSSLSTEEAANAGRCLATVFSIRDFLEIYQEAQGTVKTVCFPVERLSANDLVEIFTDYVRENPEHAQAKAGTVAYFAYVDKYPCSGK
jgi:hypothetical protein